VLLGPVEQNDEASTLVVLEASAFKFEYAKSRTIVLLLMVSLGCMVGVGVVIARLWVPVPSRFALVLDYS